MTTAEAIDRLALRDLQARYARGVDRRDLTLVRSCFTDDCRYDGTLGRGTIDVAVTALRHAMRRYRATFHLVATQRIDVHGGAADVDTYAIAHHVRREADLRHYTVGVRYVDACRRGPDGWLIEARTVRRVWERDGLVPLF